MAYNSHYEIMNHDTDINGIIRPSLLLRYMQETANRQMRDSRPTYRELFDEGKAFILSRMVVKAHRKITEYEKIRVATWPSNQDKGASFTRCYVVYSGEEEIARGLGLWAFVDINTKSLLRISDMDFSNYEMGVPFEMSGLRFRIPKEELKFVGEYKVHYPLIDCNRHMNNTNYPDMLLNFIPEKEKHYVSDFSISYKVEAPLNSVLKIEISDPHKNEDKSITYYFRTWIDEKVNTEAIMTLKNI